MADFKPSIPYTVPILLMTPTKTTSKGVTKKVYNEEEGVQIFCSWKTFGGTEVTKDGVYSVLDTATVETWYRPDLKADCRIKDLETESVYEIIGKPEDINRRHQFLKFKVQAVEGGA